MVAQNYVTLATRYGSRWINERDPRALPSTTDTWRLTGRQVASLNRGRLAALVPDTTKTALYAAVGVVLSAGNEAQYRKAAEVVTWAAKRLTKGACPECPDHALAARAQALSLQAAARFYAPAQQA